MLADEWYDFSYHILNFQTRKPVAAYVAKYDYDNRAQNHLSFRKGEIMYVTDQSDEGWWLAKSWNGEQTGYIPSNYVAKWQTLSAEE